MLRIGELNKNDLLQSVGRSIEPNTSLDDLGYLMAYEAVDGSGFGLSNLWEQVKIEFRTLICTDDPRYKSVRKQAESLSPQETTAIVSCLSAGLGAYIGVSGHRDSVSSAIHRKRLP